MYARNDSDWRLVAGLAEQLEGEELLAGIKEERVQEPESTLVGHADAVKGICLLPESGNVVSVTADLSLNVWDPRAGEILKRMKGPVGDIALARLSATTMAVGDSYGNVSVWDLETGAKACQFPRQKRGTTAIASISPTSFVSGSMSGVLKIWNFGEPAPAATLNGHTSAIEGLQIRHAPETRIFSCSRDGTVRVWDLTGACLGSVVAVANHRCALFQTLSSSGDKLFLAWRAEMICLAVDGATSSLTIEWRQPSEEAISSLALVPAPFSPNGRDLVAAGTSSGLISFYDQTTVVYSIPAHKKAVSTLVFEPAVGRLVSSDGADIKIWRLPSQAALDEWTPGERGEGWKLETVSVDPRDGSVYGQGQSQSVRRWIPDDDAYVLDQDYAGPPG